MELSPLFLQTIFKMSGDHCSKNLILFKNKTAWSIYVIFGVWCFFSSWVRPSYIFFFIFDLSFGGNSGQAQNGILDNSINSEYSIQWIIIGYFQSVTYNYRLKSVSEKIWGVCSIWTSKNIVSSLLSSKMDKNISALLF